MTNNTNVPKNHKEHFKNWIRKRLITEFESQFLTVEDAQAWGEAFIEMGSILLALADVRGANR